MRHLRAHQHSVTGWTPRTSSERFGHQNGHQHGATGRYWTGRNGTCGRFSQYKSTLVRTERNGRGWPQTIFECGAFNRSALSMAAKRSIWF